MFQLYKKRNFSDFINDTFQFFKLQGKHYFKNYFTINGALLLLLVVLIYFVFKIYFEFIFSTLSGGMQPNDNAIANMISNNFGIIAVFAILFFLLLIFISLIQFAFPVVYFDLYDTKKGSDFSVKDIIDGLKSKTLKILKFFLVMIFLMFPLFIIVFGILILLCFIIIGFPLLLIAFPAMLSWINISFYHYLTSEDLLFSSLSIGFDYLKQQFWPIVGSTIVMYFIIQIVMSIFTLIPYIFGMVSLVAAQSSGQNNMDKLSAFSVTMTIMMVVSTLFSYILNNLLMVNQGMIYYGQKESNLNTFSKSAIDLIGTDSE